MVWRCDKAIGSVCVYVFSHHRGLKLGVTKFHSLKHPVSLLRTLKLIRSFGQWVQWTDPVTELLKQTNIWQRYTGYILVTQIHATIECIDSGNVDDANTQAEKYWRKLNYSCRTHWLHTPRSKKMIPTGPRLCKIFSFYWPILTEFSQLRSARVGA